MRDAQQSVANGDDYEKSDDASGDSSREKMLDTQVAMTGLGVLEHDGRCGTWLASSPWASKAIHDHSDALNELGKRKITYSYSETHWSAVPSRRST